MELSPAHATLQKQKWSQTEVNLKVRPEYSYIFPVFFLWWTSRIKLFQNFPHELSQLLGPRLHQLILKELLNMQMTYLKNLSIIWLKTCMEYWMEHFLADYPPRLQLKQQEQELRIASVWDHSCLEHYTRLHSWRVTLRSRVVK